MNNKILLVDDEVLQLKIMERLLKSDGYQCISVTSVQEAELVLKHQIPDLIISDYEMPEANGFVFREKLLKNDALKNVPFLFLTSFNQEDLVQKGLDLQALDYIPKNIPPSQLLAKINNLMNTVHEHYQKSLSEIKNIAKKLNLSNIPAKAPILKHFEIHYFNQSYQNHPGGDFIDFIKINERYTVLILGDVMGKKWGAWFFSFSFLSYIRSAVRICVLDENLSLKEILSKINKVIYADEFLKDIFSTLSMVLVDDEEAKITYAGAGDLPLLKFSHQHDELSSHQSDGILLGFLENSTFSEQDINFEVGEEAYLVSDGMIDFEVNAVKKSDINLLKKRLYDLKVSGKSTEEIKEILFNKEVSQIDDCSFIIIKRK
ncbi:response regulator [Pedobacter aquae]|uniref:Response regulator n=1 Tax=Pedobacter aquae TaxID=2605747 RepID=A0A5C0VHT1_9SPHI|nr:response regulator [Pedobacter aquae]QEK51231.1 response regulator [Pedobacter aquae]